MMMGLSLTEADIASFIALMQPSVDAYNVVDRLPDNLPLVKYPRVPGYRPQPEENEHNAWYYKTRVEGASQGKLAGKTVVLKDNVMLAGVPMMNGSSTLEGYTPEVDATIVTRILDAGGVILGKSHCECLLPVRWKSHQRDRPGTQPVQDGVTRREARPRAARCWSRWAKRIWRLEEIRGAPSACLRPSAGSTA